jgi:hypothetical protein
MGQPDLEAPVNPARRTVRQVEDNSCPDCIVNGDGVHDNPTDRRDDRRGPRLLIVSGQALDIYF